MVARDGEIMDNFDAYGFEWQVSPEDPQLFLEARSPQLPFEKCRMPTAARPSRRHLRQNADLFDSASTACASATGLMSHVVRSRSILFPLQWLQLSIQLFWRLLVIIDLQTICTLKICPLPL